MYIYLPKQSRYHHKLKIQLICFHIKITYIYTFIYTVTIPSHTYNTIVSHHSRFINLYTYIITYTFGILSHTLNKFSYHFDAINFRIIWLQLI